MLFIVGDAADDDCEVLVELVFCIRGCGDCRGIHVDKGDWSIVGAYTLTRVTGPAVVLSRRVRSRSEPLLIGSIMLSRMFLTAKPTPYSLCSLAPVPCQ